MKYLIKKILSIFENKEIKEGVSTDYQGMPVGDWFDKKGRKNKKITSTTEDVNLVNTRDDSYDKQAFLRNAYLNAKREFTGDELQQRKEEILIFLKSMKDKNKSV